MITKSNTYCLHLNRFWILIKLIINHLVLKPAVVVLVLLIYLLICTLFHSYNLSHNPVLSLIINGLFLLYLGFHICINWLACSLADTSQITDDDISFMKEEETEKSKYFNKKQKLCLQCQRYHYPTGDRMYYCQLCNKCIVKRCHHCMLLGKCVGQRNQALFVKSQMWLIVGSIYTLYMQYMYYLNSQQNKPAQFVDIFRIVPVYMILMVYWKTASLWYFWIHYSIKIVVD